MSTPEFETALKEAVDRADRPNTDPLEVVPYIERATAEIRAITAEVHATFTRTAIENAKNTPQGRSALADLRKAIKELTS